VVLLDKFFVWSSKTARRSDQIVVCQERLRQTAGSSGAFN
jgi:hypothetical protein